MVLTKEEIVRQDWWNQNVAFIEKNSADGEGSVVVYRISNFFVSDTTYERLLSMFVGSYYVNARTLSEVTPKVVTEDLIKTRDALGGYFCIFQNTSSIKP